MGPFGAEYFLIELGKHALRSDLDEQGRLFGIQAANQIDVTDRCGERRDHAVAIVGRIDHRAVRRGAHHWHGAGFQRKLR